MNRYQSRLTPKAGELGLAPINNNISRTEQKEKSHHQQQSQSQSQHRQQRSVLTLRKPQKEKEPEVASPCICHRAKQLVLCQRCGTTFQGRVKRDCVQHPRASFLLDLGCCPVPQCKAGLEFLKEFPNPSIAQQQQLPRPMPRQRLNSVKKRKCDTPENSEMEMGDID